MTIQIPRVQVSGDFIARVEAFRQARLAHHQTVDIPAPIEHPLIESCIKRMPQTDGPDDYVADYQIVDPPLEKRKAELVAEIERQASVVIDKAMSPGKRRLFQFSVSDVSGKKPETITDADKIMMAKHQLLSVHNEAVGRHAAKLHAQIEDLTEDTIKTWTPEAFPEA
jgi:hypothetical protein